MKKTILALIAVLIVTGCVSTTVTPLSKQHFDPVPTDQIKLYRDITKIPGSYVVIARLHAQEPFTFTDDQSAVIRAAKKQAGPLGANGLVLGSFNAPEGRTLDLICPGPFTDDSELPAKMNPATQEEWTDILAVHVIK